jgi:hypothetical protein
MAASPTSLLMNCAAQISSVFSSIPILILRLCLGETVLFVGQRDRGFFRHKGTPFAEK